MKERETWAEAVWARAHERLDVVGPLCGAHSADCQRKRGAVDAWLPDLASREMGPDALMSGPSIAWNFARRGC